MEEPVPVVGGGMEMGMSGLDIRVEIWLAWAARAAELVGFWDEEEGEGRSFLVGRCEGREREVGMDSGIGSDILSRLSSMEL